MTDPAIRPDTQINSDAADRLFLLTAKLETARGMCVVVTERNRGELQDYIEMCIAIARGIYRVDR